MQKIELIPLNVILYLQRFLYIEDAIIILRNICIMYIVQIKSKTVSWKTKLEIDDFIYK